MTKPKQLRAKGVGRKRERKHSATAAEPVSCPVCGGLARAMQTISKYGVTLSPPLWSVECVAPLFAGCLSASYHEARTDAVAAWNRRAPKRRGARP